jgi:hypothetical protein
MIFKELIKFRVIGNLYKAEIKQVTCAETIIYIRLLICH